MRLKKQYGNFDHYYVTIPDLHFRKSLMYAVVRQYELLGIKHLAKLYGYITENQWHYIKNVCSIHKWFEFLERLCESLHFSILLESKTIAKKFFELSKDSLAKVFALLKDFIQKCCAHDHVFPKGTDLANVIETIISRYTTERSRNWDLRTASLKESIHFAIISNYTQYGSLLIKMLFHQFSFQERYLNLMKEGFFTYKL